tara:strand:- start:45 stop:326 length:282 start_codon:yes stop_codon:yes gene_type:complete
MKKLVNGQIVDMTAEEISARQAEEQAWNDGAFSRDMENLRAKRNRLLAETDFYALSDVTMSSEMETYRQELRDLTNGLTTVEQVEAVVFPTKP